MSPQNLPNGFKAFFTAVQFGVVPIPACGKGPDALLTHFNGVLDAPERSTWAAFEVEMQMMGEKLLETWRSKRLSMRKAGVHAPVSVLEVEFKVSGDVPSGRLDIEMASKRAPGEPC